MDDERDYFTRRDLGWYDMQGQPISMIEMAKLEQINPKYRIVGRTKTFFFDVSTVLLGLDHGFRMGGAPVIFETMVFTRWKLWRRSCTVMGMTRKGYWSADSVNEKRYCTLAQAKGGHIDMVEAYSGRFGLYRFLLYWIPWLGKWTS